MTATVGYYSYSFLFLFLCFYVSLFGVVKWSTSASCPPSVSAQTVTFIHHKNFRKKNTKEKLSAESAEQQDCELQCARRFGCSSYDYSSNAKYCELNFNNKGEDVIGHQGSIEKKKGWIHAQKKIISVWMSGIRRGVVSVSVATTVKFYSQCNYFIVSLSFVEA